MKRILSRHRTDVLAVIVVLCGSAAQTLKTPAHAADPATADQSGQLEEIVVTANKRAENLQNVPISVTALTASTLQESGVDSSVSLPRLTPGLTINSGAAFFSPFIRGVGTEYANIGLESSVAVYLDDMYSARPVVGFGSFTDLNRVEVLEGPQGTLYGRNASAGAIRVITNDPVNEFQARGEADYGSFGRSIGEGMLNLPFGETLSGRVAVRYEDRNPYIQYTEGEPPRYHDLQVRGKLLWQPIDDLKFKLTIDHSEHQDPDVQGWINVDPSAPESLGLAAGGKGSSSFYQTTSSQGNINYFGSGSFPFAGSSPYSGQMTKINQTGEQFRADWTTGAGTFSSITGFRQSKVNTTCDLDATSAPFEQCIFLEYDNSYSEELQFISGDWGPVGLTSGLYFFRESGRSVFDIFGEAINEAVGMPFGPTIGVYAGNPAEQLYTGNVTTEAWAPYSQIDWKITDQFTLTLGGRYSHEYKTLGNETTSLVNLPVPDIVLADTPYLKDTFSHFTPKAELSYRPVKDVLLYAEYSEGFKSGGFNTPGNDPTVTIKPEYLKSYEMGWKTEFYPIRFNGSLFYYDYKDLQVEGRNIATGAASLSNAANAKIYGAQVQIDVAVTRNFNVSLGGNYLDSKFEDFLGDAVVPASGQPACIAAGGRNSGAPACGGYTDVPANFSGGVLPDAPKFTGYVNGSYDFALPSDAGTLHVNSILSYTSRYFYNPEETLGDSPRFLLSSAITWKSRDTKLEVGVYGDNLTNVQYNELESTSAAGAYRIPAEPRTWGVRAAYKTF